MSIMRLRQLWSFIDRMNLSQESAEDGSLIEAIVRQFDRKHHLSETEANAMRMYLSLRLPLVREIARPAFAAV
ncbi:MAG: hypothetical protein AAFX40_15285 [Cyanobacteria bacterium J06639_1]